MLFNCKCFGQQCDLSVEGFVFDEALQRPLAYVNVFIQETQMGAISDEEGKFVLNNICPGHYHFIVSHIGCEDEKFHFDIFKDTIITIELSHTPTSLGTIVVEGKKDNFNNQANLSINRKAIEDNSNQSLSAMLENETGVHLIKNGNGISKPIVHGLYGNRLMILNNGIIQSGQQWGNDHSPEIDPFASDKITVIKGASALEYGGGNLGSIVLSEPKRIKQEPHLHGQANYIFETNGRGHTLNTRLGKYAPILAWQVTGTLKKYGDKKSADYFLNNTGIEEANFSVQLEKTIKEKLFIEVYLSTFNSKLGVLRGSHIGNLTDLKDAFNRREPFFTEEKFSYSLEAPKQEVSHHLIKSKIKYFFNDNESLSIVAAGQLNNRKEFDIRRSGRTDIPALYLSQSTLNTDLKYANEISENWIFKAGHQFILTDNANNPESGVLPLIPDYLSWKNGFFSSISLDKNSSSLNLGIRYDYENQIALTISNTQAKEIIRFENQYNNVSALLSLKTEIVKNQSIGWNLGYAMRNPAINELYSNGLHQGVSGIEEGDVNLKTEQAIKNTLEYKWVPSSSYALNILLYHQHFKDYIYLNPQEEFRLTIRGAFPVFKYEQTNANIYGLDFSSQFTINSSFFGLIKYSFLKGVDLKNDTPLIFMPPNSLFGSVTYRASKSIKLGKGLRIENSELEISNRYVFEQNNILMGQDFLAPPEAYNLLGLKLSTNVILPSYKLRFFAKVDNAFNVNYRDYLNRQRYFADDIGLSFIFGLNIKF